MIFDAFRRWMGGSDESSGNGDAADNGDVVMIPCADALARLYEFLDGELDGVSHEEVDEHFRICSRCYPRLQIEERFREALHRAIDRQQAPPDHLRDRVLAALEGEVGGG